MTTAFTPLITARQQGWIARRRDLHRYPELGFQEVRTAGIVAATLNRLGLEVQTGVGQTGVVGLLEGGHDGPTVLVRADMDALPITEENTTDYASQTPGVMHACGHDAHTTIALAVAELLSEHRAEIAGRVKFIFQPAEELGRGANAMIDEGVLEHPAPDVALGLHLWNESPVGVLALTAGPFMAGAGDFSIRVEGRGGHGAAPHETRDPIVAASAIVSALQTVITRSVPPVERAVISVTSFQAGTAFNVIPSRAELRGTIRMFRPEIRALLEARMREVTQGVAAAHGCTAELEIRDLMPPVTNDPAVTERLRRLFRQIRPDLEQVTDMYTMFAEDMAYFLDAVPGTYFFVGSSDPARGLDYPHHHPRFDFDEAVIPLAVELMTAAVASYVLPGYTAADEAATSAN